MNIHEYQARNLLVNYGINVPEGEVIGNLDEALEVFKKMKRDKVVMKAQVHSGGRGKAGGVRFAANEEDISNICDSLLGKRLVTKQTGEEGKPIEKLLISETTAIDKELYYALTVDRSSKTITMIVSEMGGIDIEEVSLESPEKILKISIPFETGMKNYIAYEAANFLKLDSEQAKSLCSICRNTYRLFLDKDCSLVEMNPLAISGEELVPVDIKINFDDNSLFRHPDIMELRDENQENPREVEASKCNVTYVALNGNIGCLVNGAGLAMATMDAIALHGGKPANFLDIGGGASAKRVADAFRIILLDSDVKGIIINIFGGITSCVSIAEGVVEAIKSSNIEVPIVCRLEGNGLQEGKEILKNAGIKLIMAESMDDAAIKMIEILKGGQA